MIQRPDAPHPAGDAAGVPTLRKTRRPRGPSGPHPAAATSHVPAAGLRSPFIPSNSFAGNRPGYVFKRGQHGPGYYLMHETGAHFPRHAIPDEFLAKLEVAEAHDRESLTPMMTGADGQIPAAAYRREHMQQRNKPDWVGVGATEAQRAYQYHGEAPFEQRQAVSRNQRSHFAPKASQVHLDHPLDPEPKPTAWRFRSIAPAGGAPNLSGATGPTGERCGLLASAGVSFLS